MKGLDTLVVAAGVSALQPLVTGVAGAQRHGSKFKDNEPSLDGIKRAKEVGTPRFLLFFAVCVFVPTHII